MAMKHDLIAKYDSRVPRYTSYPTAPHFHNGVGAQAYRAWLAELPADAPLSLYLHIPFCDTLCWFCGCHTTVVNTPAPVERYLDVLHREIELVTETWDRPRRISHLHLGGGSPTMLAPERIAALFQRLRERCSLGADAEIAVEIDPRGLSEAVVAAFAAAGLSRASIGVQDFDPAVQRAVNRIQPFEVTRAAVEMLRGHGVGSINIDLMYGLPRQTLAGTLSTLEQVLELRPQRIALFGYAHVPWMKRHQRLIREDELPDAAARWAQFDAAAKRLAEAGYVRVGLDHFALPTDSMTAALRAGRLRRNFQGYTTDGAPALLGLGASAIGRLPQGYVQNHTVTRDYIAAIQAGMPATARGVALDPEDRLRAAVIERLMCDMHVDLAREAGTHGFDLAVFYPAIAALGRMQADRLVRIDGSRVTVHDSARPLLRAIAGVFDSYLKTGETRHAKAV